MLPIFRGKTRSLRPAWVMRSFFEHRFEGARHFDSCWRFTLSRPQAHDALWQKELMAGGTRSSSIPVFPKVHFGARPVVFFSIVSIRPDCASTNAGPAPGLHLKIVQAPRRGEQGRWDEKTGDSSVLAGCARFFWFLLLGTAVSCGSGLHIRARSIGYCDDIGTSEWQERERDWGFVLCRWGSPSRDPRRRPIPTQNPNDCVILGFRARN